MQSSNEHDDPGIEAEEPSAAVPGHTGAPSARGSGLTTALRPLAGYGAALPVGFLAHASPLVLVAVGALALAHMVAAEWQRRRTLVAVLRNAPKGSVVEQDGGAGGPFMRVRIGSPTPRGKR